MLFVYPANLFAYPDMDKDMRCECSLKEAEEYDMDGMSGARGRGADGRYVSRESSNNRQSYDDGYSRGYSEAMNQMNRSGHYPYPNFPRW